MTRQRGGRGNAGPFPGERDSHCMHHEQRWGDSRVRQRILVFMPGTSPKPTRYRLADAPRQHDPVTASWTPVALIQLQKQLGLADYPDKVLALSTEAVYEKRDELRADFVIDGHEIPVEFVRIKDGRNSEELREMIEALLSNVPDHADLVIDITHGFRGGPLVFSLAVQYLSLVNPSVAVKEMYYGMFREATPDNPEETSVIVSMAPYLDMLDWVYAMRVFRDTLVPTRLLEKIRASAKSAGEADGSFAELVQSLELFSAAIEAALPIEMAETAVRLRSTLALGLPKQLQDIPLGDKLFHALDEVAAEFVPPGDQVPAELNDAELRRQAKIIDKLLEHGRTVQAVGLMHEWCTLKVLRHNSPRLHMWRDREEQARANTLRTRGKWAKQELKRAVEKIRAMRHPLHHYAQQETNEINLEDLQDGVRRIWSQIKAEAEHDSHWKIRDKPASVKDRPMHTLGDYVPASVKPKKRR